MSLAPYYIGDNVPLAFNITENGTAVQATSGAVIIRKPDASITESAEAAIDGDSPYEVSYTVPTTVTILDGEYYAFFEMELPGGLVRTHRIKFIVAANPG